MSNDVITTGEEKILEISEFLLISSSFFHREVQKSMNHVKDLHEKWKALLNNPATVGREDYNLTTSELRNSIRSIEWDLEDLEETIQIVEGNQRKFNLGPEEIENRKAFVKQTKQDLSEIKASVNSPAAQAKVQSSNRQVSICSKIMILTSYQL